MSVSSDGGMTWGSPQETADRATGAGAGTGAPLVQPDGRVVVPTRCWSPLSHPCSDILAFESADGGRTWRPAHVIASTETAVNPLNGFPAATILSAAIDGTGRLYLAWADCRFRAGCSGNDIVMTTSIDGRTWTPVSRVTSGPGDHIVPGIGADPLSAGRHARIAITYYTIPDPHCIPASCVLDARFTSSPDGGATWSRPARLGRPVRASWLAKIPGGVMLSDWIGTAVFPAGNAITAFPLATKPSGTTFHQDIYAVQAGMQIHGTGLRPGR